MNSSKSLKYQRFGRRLRLLRNKSKITQEKFCETVGCTTRTLYRWEQGLAYPMEVYRPLVKKVLPKIGKI